MTFDGNDARAPAPLQTSDEQRKATGRPAHDVFVSYSAQDKPVADAIVSLLEAAGVRCWVAPRDVLPGTVWGEAIVQAIDASRLMVVVFSGKSDHSGQVIREVERAASHGVVVIPFRIESIEPTGAMAYFLASEHWLDAMTPPLEAHIAELVHVAQATLGRAATTLREPVASPAPIPPNRGRHWRRAAALIAGGVLVIVGAIAAVFFFIATRDEPAKNVAMAQVTAGDCLQTPKAYAEKPLRFWAGSKPWPVRMGVVPCNQSHGGEVFFAGDVWSKEAAYPGDQVVNGDKTFDRCVNAFEDYVGSPYHKSVYEIQERLPTIDTWRYGDRMLACIAYDPGGNELTSTIKRSFR